MELVIVHLKKLKTISLFNKVLIILLIFTVLRTIYIVKNNIIKTKYNSDTKEIIGYINDIKIDGDKLTVELKEAEKIIFNYYFKDLEEIDSFKKTFKMGDYIKVDGVIKSPNNNTVFNLFNYRKYLLSKKVYWLFNGTKISKIKNNTSVLYNIKNNIYKRISLIKKSSDYIKAFILGTNDDISSEALLSYQKIGINHLLAVSGMHITILSSIILKIINLFSKKKKLNYFLVIIFICIYMFLNNFTPSVLRAGLLFILLSINKQFNINLKTIKIFIIILILFLLYNPYYIYNVGFLFSFIISFFLILLSNKINKYNAILKLLLTSIISFLVSFPIVVNNYYQINLLAPLINIIFIPLVSIIIFPLSLITFIFPFLDNIMFFFINLMELLSLYISKIIFLNVILGHINYFFFILYYILIILILFKSKKYIFLFFIFLIIHSNISYFNKYPIITMIDVGQGDSILIELPHNKGNILIDTGGITKYDKFIERKKEYSIAIDSLIPFFKSKGIKKIDFLILTHGDNDHMGEAINLVENFKIDNVIFNNGTYNSLELDLINILKKYNINYYQKKEKLNIGIHNFYFLNDIIYDNENDNSNVIYTVINGVKIILMGDAGANVEKELIKRYNLKDIDILKVGHHGSNTSSSKDFIDSINPKYSLISVGENNRYGHPKESVLDILKKSFIYRTDQDGSIMFKIKNNKLEIITCS